MRQWINKELPVPYFHIWNISIYCECIVFNKNQQYCVDTILQRFTWCPSWPKSPIWYDLLLTWESPGMYWFDSTIVDRLWTERLFYFFIICQIQCHQHVYTKTKSTSFHRWLFQMHFANFSSFDKISFNFFPMYSINDKPRLFLVMGWQKTGQKSLFEPMSP